MPLPAEILFLFLFFVLVLRVASGALRLGACTHAYLEECGMVRTHALLAGLRACAGLRVRGELRWWG